MKFNFNAWAEIEIDNIAHNIQKLRQRVGSDIKIIAVIKANAYGHGACEIANALLENGADFLGVATHYEGRALRKSGITKKIFITNAILPEEAKKIIRYELTPFVYTKELIIALNNEGEKLNKLIPVHIKVDTGMGRLGVAPENFLDFLAEFKNLKNLKIEGILTHFARADKDEEYTRFQLKRFSDILQKLKDDKINIDFIHSANSAALLKYTYTHFNMVRPGISLYGLYPSAEFHDIIDLKPVMRVKSKVAYIKSVPIGTSISYGQTFVTSRPSVIAIVPVGYADGYPRLLSNNGEVLINGKRAKVVGNVCMDSFMVDVTDFQSVKLGDIVTLLGPDGDREISAEEWAEKTGTINYEIVSRIGHRLPRVYIRNGKVEKIKYL
ncbi:alanine racemase [Candidatus Poribacteria bacterium]|nr:alanine racemase [Candidatus Poribacteria bacterium]